MAEAYFPCGQRQSSKNNNEYPHSPNCEMLLYVYVMEEGEFW